MYLYDWLLCVCRHSNEIWCGFFLFVVMRVGYSWFCQSSNFFPPHLHPEWLCPYPAEQTRNIAVTTSFYSQLLQYQTWICQNSFFKTEAPFCNYSILLRGHGVRKAEKRVTNAFKEFTSSQLLGWREPGSVVGLGKAMLNRTSACKQAVF